MRKALSLCIATAVVLAAPAIIPAAAAQGLAPNYYGTADTNYHFISAEEFQQTSRNHYRMESDGFWTALSNLQYFFVAPLRLPTGALVDGYTVIYEDSDADKDLSFALYRHWVGSLGSTGTAQIGTTFTSSGSPGVRSTWVDLDPDLTIDYYLSFSFTTQSYVLHYITDLSDNLRFRGVIVQWKRQVSPAPATATFVDVPLGSFGFKHVEALAASGITAGCGGGNFCPTNTLTRVEMAVFLAKALGLHWSP